MDLLKKLFVKELINNVSSILIICLGAKLIMDNQLEIGSLITFNFTISHLISYVLVLY